MTLGAASLERRKQEKAFAPRVAEWICLCAGLVLILLAVLADHGWLDRHLLPQKFVPRSQQILVW